MVKLYEQFLLVFLCNKKKKELRFKISQIYQFMLTFQILSQIYKDIGDFLPKREAYVNMVSLLSLMLYFTYPAEYGQMERTPPGNLSFIQIRFNTEPRFAYALSRYSTNVPRSIDVSGDRREPFRSVCRDSFG